LALGWRADETRPKMIDFPGYAYTREPSAISGKTRIRYDDAVAQTWHIPFFGSLVPTTTVTLPAAGWWVPPPWADIVEARLKPHGIVATRTSGPGREHEVEVFHVDEIKHTAGTYEGRAVMTMRGHRVRERRVVGAGGLFVPVRQARARLAAHLLEPEAGDSLVSWGFFAGVFERKEYMEDYVLEDVAAQMLKDPAVKRAFDERVARDAEFARSPRQRLDFFYRRHPSWDAQMEVVPIVRMDEQP
jgi:hypothetical protein